MDVVELLPHRLHLLRFPVGQAYLWRDGKALTLIDAGPPGSGAASAAVAGSFGTVRRIVLTHFHEDHAGGAAELAELTGEPEVLAHHADAPVVRSELPPPPPVFEDWERPLYAKASQLLPQGNWLHPPAVTDLSDGDTLDFGGGAQVIHVPGHTDGSIALHLPAHGVLFTGDTVAASPVDGKVLLGVFNLDRPQAIASFHRLAELDTDVACFGHGDPVIGKASAAIRSSADTYRASD
ncbi:MBL fold metallo-hydrolase [Streptomyces sp. NPDC047081]|uniref:MBL fold metallo-hydrolase n=1 Tax=Streptomyces sp. NPDC047081 TaxID=3154706 RepID=UPI0033E61326